MASHILQLYHTRKAAKNQYFFCEFFATSFRLPQKVFTPECRFGLFFYFLAIDRGQTAKRAAQKATPGVFAPKGRFLPKACVKKPTAGVRLAVGFL